METIEPILDDFVNRDDERILLWKMARREVDPTIMVYEGDAGLGKTYLLHEFRAECREFNIELVYLDFEERYEDPGYMYVVKEFWRQLGPDGFEAVGETMDEIMASSQRATAQQGLQDIRGSEKPAPESSSQNGADEMQQTSVENKRPEGTSRSGGVNIYGGENTIRDVAGRDIIHFVQVVRQEDPYVQIQVPGQIAEALKDCLVPITTQRQIIFFFDHWDNMDSDTRKWLAGSVVKWAADALLPQAIVVLAGVEGLDLEPRRRLKRSSISELSEDDIYEYLVDIYRVDKEDVPNIIAVTGGLPMMLYLYIKRQNLKAKPR